MEQTEQDNLNILEGEVQQPAERAHLFKNHNAVCDFVKTFGIRNYNVREGTLDTTGEYVVELRYQPVNNP